MEKLNAAIFVACVSLNDLERSRLNACTYCGSTTDMTRDHVIPVAWKGFGRDYNKGDTVPACRECNSEIGDAAIFSVQERAAYLMGIYRRKYRKILSFPDWHDSEFVGMDERMISSINSSILQRDIVVLRMTNLSFVSDGNYEKIDAREQGRTFSQEYRILTIYLNSKGGHNQKVIETAKALKESIDSVRVVVNENGDVNALNTFKHDHRIPFDVKIRRVRS